MSPELPRFQQQQQAFTAYVRNPDVEPLPEQLEPQRMQVYRELFEFGLNEQMSGAFPVLRAIIDDDHWRAMMRDFLIRHRSQTPLFTELAGEFIDYLANEREPHPSDPPFLLELAHYEYMEVVVAISDADRELPPTLDNNGDLLNAHPLVAPTAMNLSYQWPVHLIGADQQPEHPPEAPSHLLIYRDRQDDVHFLEINAVTQRMLALLQENPRSTGLEVITQIAQELQHPDPDVVLNAGAELLADLRERNVILGTVPV